ncbi:hypothetical protein EJ02DRAFT_50161 [Clathrospora elynae]|uniref:Uncharacterized protein n=1 Tax=Clathrospora elynae TaxID=706981 RepID=A0A6A5SGI1_9PLEO|nr:hypothetical protein EJ02DRAFT_50161 [Clathrospora elynae]
MSKEHGDRPFRPLGWEPEDEAAYFRWSSQRPPPEPAMFLPGLWPAFPRTPDNGNLYHELLLARRRAIKLDAIRECFERLPRYVKKICREDLDRGVLPFIRLSRIQIGPVKRGEALRKIFVHIFPHQSEESDDLQLKRYADFMQGMEHDQDDILDLKRLSDRWILEDDLKERISRVTASTEDNVPRQSGTKSVTPESHGDNNEGGYSMCAWHCRPAIQDTPGD